MAENNTTSLTPEQAKVKAALAGMNTEYKARLEDYKSDEKNLTLLEDERRKYIKDELEEFKTDVVSLKKIYSDLIGKNLADIKNFDPVELKEKDPVAANADTYKAMMKEIPANEGYRVFQINHNPHSKALGSGVTDVVVDKNNEVVLVRVVDAAGNGLNPSFTQLLGDKRTLKVLEKTDEGQREKVLVFNKDTSELNIHVKNDLIKGLPSNGEHEKHLDLHKLVALRQEVQQEKKEGIELNQRLAQFRTEHADSIAQLAAIDKKEKADAAKEAALAQKAKEEAERAKGSPVSTENRVAETSVLLPNASQNSRESSSNNMALYAYAGAVILGILGAFGISSESTMVKVLSVGAVISSLAIGFIAAGKAGYGPFAAKKDKDSEGKTREVEVPARGQEKQRSEEKAAPQSSEPLPAPGPTPQGNKPAFASNSRD